MVTTTGGIPQATINRLELKHGCAIDRILGTIYVLHFNEPVVLHSVSNDYPTRPDYDRRGFKSQPIRHYVGWTQQHDYRRRVSRHGPDAVKHVVQVKRGTLDDEEQTKRHGTCPVCGEALTP